MAAARFLPGISGVRCSAARAPRGSCTGCSRGSEPPQKESASPRAASRPWVRCSWHVQHIAGHAIALRVGGGVGQGFLPTQRCSERSGQLRPGGGAQTGPGCPWRAPRTPRAGRTLCPKAHPRRCGYIVIKIELTKFCYCVLRRCFPLYNWLLFYIPVVLPPAELSMGCLPDETHPSATSLGKRDLNPSSHRHNFAI